MPISDEVRCTDGNPVPSTACAEPESARVEPRTLCTFASAASLHLCVGLWAEHAQRQSRNAPGRELPVLSWSATIASVISALNGACLGAARSFFSPAAFSFLGLGAAFFLGAAAFFLGDLAGGASGAATSSAGACSCSSDIL
jgi:hypothetical protein